MTAPRARTHSATPSDEPLQSVHSSTFPQVLHELGASVWVTTYQAGKLVILRNDGGVLNTHFRNLSKPMGLAWIDGRLAIGCSTEICEFHNVEGVCNRLNESRDYPSHEAVHDACYLPLKSNCTGDVLIHEMAWQVEPTTNAELIFANTAFSCLATRSDQNSFEPIWRPNFIKQLSPGDHCHLNGLAMRDQRTAYVTALGKEDHPGAWRGNKRDGGVLIDVNSDEFIAEGLSMPHSPRWYQDRLWLLESGNGSLGVVDLDTGKYDAVARFPGFTRGLSFLGPYAFVGLSQVRESTVFSGIPLVEKLNEAEQRSCGVWVVHIETGETVAFCRFEHGVQEIFAVEVIPGARFPDLVNHDPKIIGQSYVLSDEALQDVPEELR